MHFFCKRHNNWTTQPLEHLMKTHGEGKATVMIRSRLLKRLPPKKDIFSGGTPNVAPRACVRAEAYFCLERQFHRITHQISIATMSSLDKVDFRLSKACGAQSLKGLYTH